MQEEQRTFTGRKRERRTRSSVKWANGIARGLITFGGVGTIIAVSTVCIYLVAVAWPLFSNAKTGSREAIDPPWSAQQQTPVHIDMDEYQLLGWVMFEDGSIQVFRSDNGEAIGEPLRPFSERRLTAWSFNSNGPDVCMGFDDGSAQLGRIEIEIEFLGENQVDEQVRRTPIGEVAMVGDALFAHTQPGQFRRHEFKLEMNAPVDLSDEPVRLLSHTRQNTGTIVIALAGDSLAINSVREIRNFLTGEVRASARRIDMPYNPRVGGVEPTHLLISELGNLAYLAWEDGLLRRYDTRNLNSPKLVEDLDLAPGEGNELTALSFLIGGTTLVSGDSEGAIKAWFCIPAAGSVDGQKLVAAHDLGMAGAEVTALSGSSRSRLLGAGLADGRLRLYHVTANQLLLENQVGDAGAADPIMAIAIGSREDSLLATSAKEMAGFEIDLKHPAVNLSSLFTKIWYEGYPEPTHTWQSSSGTDKFEPKYGLVPLIFGTLKATFYSMLFGLPIALLAAIFTSEFLHPRVKSRIKPLVEMMASLPSVVLGFLAALVIAPMVENVVPAVIASFVTLPLAFLSGAYIWQLMPRALAMRLERHRFAIICLMIPVGISLALAIGPLAERALFAGDFELYMDGQRGTGSGGWFILLTPLCGILTVWLLNVFVNDRFREWSHGWSRLQVAVFDGLKFTAAVVVWLAITWGLAWSLTTVGFDPRGDDPANLLGTYVQRNAMVVGFIMGFAIIPIIYTLAEDALSSVPEHLRSASLGAGATPWQTAVRIIIPSAMSGLFSAAMIGLGRAVGETMIVLMAAGNTPVMQMNIFNGFRTLSANIAVEMPEAPVGGTHYRVLFLAALALFAMTFAVNTVAEIVRQRFRKRAYQL